MAIVENMERARASTREFIIRQFKRSILLFYPNEGFSDIIHSSKKPNMDKSRLGKILVTIFIVVTLFISAYLSNMISDQVPTIKYIEANNFTAGEVFLFSCAKESMFYSNSTGKNTENYKKIEIIEFIAIILEENELQVKIGFLEGNRETLITKENNELNLNLVKNHSYAFVELDSETGEMIQVRYPILTKKKS